MLLGKWMSTGNGSEPIGEASLRMICLSTKMMLLCLNHNNWMSATTMFLTKMRTMLLFYHPLLTVKRLPILLHHLLHCAPLPRPLHCHLHLHQPPAPVTRTLMAHHVRLPSSSLVEAQVSTGKSPPLSLIIERVTIPALHLRATKVERPGYLVSTIRVVPTVNRAHLPAPRVIRATGHTTRAIAKKGKMCATLHKKTFADRGELCPVFLSAIDCCISVASLQP